MECLDDFAFIDEAFDGDFDAVSEAPGVNFEDLDLALDVQLLVFCPAVDIAYPSQLTWDTDASAKARSHSSFGEPR